MQPENWSRVLSSAVVPVVIISACGLLCLAFYNRLATLISRLRGLHREHMDEQQQYARCLFSGELDRVLMIRHHRVLEMLQVQTERLSRRLRLVRGTLLCLLATVACQIACSVATGISVLWLPAMYVAAGFFLLAAPLFLAGIVYAMLDMKSALEPVELEREFVSRLSKELDELTRNGGTAP